ncbi:TPA: hypothetical protein ACOEBN_000370 [Stenotrophomonas maltophilia]|uniref:hypothetical protein n=1 Tax=Stenotrophomonas maltophilia TaxID=40324 RepID=UPI002097E519|nr:hypothetical protein [Stenotrophomonas maltophilia]MCO7478370.1 hypothetical protein [Stenotrophomonas maltophilia]MCO7478382.1 hypothetical protein [Stenotrophomonas maltophilia]UVH75166.1 hypothetical protein NW343_11075 [Stenotrophomonas maltophilia]
MSKYPPFLAELAEFDMGLWACAVFVALVLGLSIIFIVIDQAWRALRYWFKWRKGNVR